VPARPSDDEVEVNRIHPMSQDSTADPREVAVSAPPYQLKADFFKTLGHPARIQVLEMLSTREPVVAETLPHMGAKSAHLSQQLAVLRRSHLVATRKEGSAAHYPLASPELTRLPSLAQTILSRMLADQAKMIAGLRAALPDNGTPGPDLS
jgi:ArsR family transcriptional regulator